MKCSAQLNKRLMRFPRLSQDVLSFVLLWQLCRSKVMYVGLRYVWVNSVTAVLAWRGELRSGLVRSVSAGEERPGGSG
jgi:hypothetical protein